MNTEVDRDTIDLMSPEVQIRCAIEQVMENIARSIFGENLSVSTEYQLAGPVSGGLQITIVDTICKSVTGKLYPVEARLPIRHPDECGGFRIDNVCFSVKAGDWANNCQFEAWCNGAKVIVHQVYPDGSERWLVADSMEREVLYRGSFESLFVWAKEVVAQKWSHLPYAYIDTEIRAARFIVGGNPADRE
jgi:hypothetical protein